MKFPGSKLLQQWDLSTRPLSFEDLFRSCREIGLTGLAELRLRDTVGLIFYYLGGEVNALYREGAVAYNGQAALDRLRARALGRVGTVSVYELPLDMAHLLRGITARKKLPDSPQSAAELDDLLSRLERAEASLHLAEFSRETWKARTEVTSPSRHRLDRPGAGPLPHEAAALGAQVLGEMLGQFPSLLHAILFELTTGAVLARVGPGAADPGLEALTRRIPAFTTFLRNQTGGPGEEDGLDYIELSMARVSVLVAMVPEALEAVAVVSDRTQPIPLAGAALRQAAADYAGRLRVLRQ